MKTTDLSSCSGMINAVTWETCLSKPTKTDICILCVNYICAEKDIYKNVN